MFCVAKLSKKNLRPLYFQLIGIKHFLFNLCDGIMYKRTKKVVKYGFRGVKYSLAYVLSQGKAEIWWQMSD